MAINPQLEMYNNGQKLGLLKPEQSRQLLMKFVHNYGYFNDFVGKTGGNIFLKREVTASNAITQIPIAQTAEAPVVYGNIELAGNEAPINFDTFQMGVYEYKFGFKQDNLRFTEFVTGFENKLFGVLEQSIKKQVSSMLTARILQGLFKTMCVNSMKPTGAADMDKAAKIFAVGDITKLVKACGIATGKSDASYANTTGNVDNISHNRIMFGNDFNNSVAANTFNQPTNATINATITQAAFTIANGHGATLNNFELAKNLAINGQRSTEQTRREHMIEPYQSTSARMGFFNKKYIVVVGEKVMAQLRLDPQWSDQVKRPFIEVKDQQPSIYTANEYEGEIRGMIFIKESLLDQYILDGNGGSKVGVSFLIGAQALAHAQNTKLTNIIKRNEAYNGREGQALSYFTIDGMMPTYFSSQNDPQKLGGLNKTVVPYGIIPIFSALN